MAIKKEITVLVVDDDAGHRKMLKTILSTWKYITKEADDGSVAIEMVHDMPPDLILMDVRMLKIDGIEALKAIKEYNPAIPVIIMTAFSDVSGAVEAIKAGAYDYLTKPLEAELLKFSIELAIEHKSLKIENTKLKDPKNIMNVGNLVGRSSSMLKMLEMVMMIAPSEAIILISGESGTGKEVVAKVIHENSCRKNGPLITVNCAALTETLLESELFGHERGSFTGAERKRDGLFLQASGGTIFLDEIGETSAAMQAKLLRVIQQREIQRVGGDHPIHVDVRIMAATNRNLFDEVSKGKFREDLYYRLNVVNLIVPPLRERGDDVPLLANYFVEKFAKRNSKKIKGFSPVAMDMLVKYSWPGNVRELENAIERAVVLSTGEFISENELPANINNSIMNNAIANYMLENISLDDLEKEAILATLSASNGNKSEAARRLGVTRKTLHAKLQKYELE